MAARKRKIPQRTCIGCNEVRDKRELIRIVRTPEREVLVDFTGKNRAEVVISVPLRLVWKRP